jgi:hypothetical protein
LIAWVPIKAAAITHGTSRRWSPWASQSTEQNESLALQRASDGHQEVSALREELGHCF